jgi:putative nucleotidyltransferase with HDIG domain
VATTSVPLEETGVPTPNALKQQALRSLGSLPPFSPILNRLLASLAQEEVSFTKLADLIEKDTVVAASVLQLVNSALYARRGTVNSVRHALSLLGVNKLRNAVLGMSITRLWAQMRTPPDWSMARFNLHSVAVAQLADMLAQKVPVAYPEGAFIAGLLHDIGQLPIAIGLPDQYAQIVERVQSEGCPTSEAESDFLGFTHSELSAEALIAWNLPVPIQEAVRDHHINAAAGVGRELPLASVVSASDRYVNSMGTSILPRPGVSVPDPSALDGLGLNPEFQRSLLADFETELANMKPFYL